MTIINSFGRVWGCILLVAGIQCAFAKEAAPSGASDAATESVDAEESVDGDEAVYGDEMVEVFPEDSIQHYQKLIDQWKPQAQSRRKTGSILMIGGGSLAAVGAILLMTSDLGSGSDCENDMFGNQTCTSNGEEEEDVQPRDVAAIALMAGGAATFFTGMFIRKSGSRRLRRAQSYETKLQYWKEISERTVSWQVQPIVDPLRGRGGMELALGF